MNGEIAQLIGLVTFGNAFLSGQWSGFFDPSSTLFKFNEHVRFVDLQKATSGLLEQPYADTPSDWYRALQSDKCAGMRLSQQSTINPHMPDRHAVAFVGGGQWQIECVLPRGSDFWAARWEIGDRDHPQQRIWRVTYGRLAQGQQTPLIARESCEEQARSLAAVLHEAKAFAMAHEDVAHFAEIFDRGLDVLKASAAPDLHDLAPKDVLPVGAAKLLSAAQGSWVFGGMGSWNDVGFVGSRQDDYDRISEALFQNINVSLAAAANASFPAAPARQRKFWP